MKHLFKSTKVVLNWHLKEYQVYYKNWFRWHYDCCYQFKTESGSGLNQEMAEKLAIERASNMLKTVEVWRG